jgi:excisionase family DNA binding protein
MTVATVTRPRIEFVTVEEAADIVGVSPVRVRQFCQDGRLGQKLGNHWLISKAEAVEFAEKERPNGRPKKSEK